MIRVVRLDCRRTIMTTSLQIEVAVAPQHISNQFGGGTILNRYPSTGERVDVHTVPDSVQLVVHMIAVMMIIVWDNPGGIILN